MQSRNDPIICKFYTDPLIEKYCENSIPKEIISRIEKRLKTGFINISEPLWFVIDKKEDGTPLWYIGCLYITRILDHFYAGLLKSCNIVADNYSRYNQIREWATGYYHDIMPSLEETLHEYVYCTPSWMLSSVEITL